MSLPIFRAHSVDRRYVAVVEGDMQHDEGRFDRDIVESENERRRIAKPGEQGIKAITEWKVLERFGVATLVEARLKTGRTHQIRIHFAFAGHSLVGDRVYRDLRRPPFPIEFSRQALHAGRLGYVNLKGETVTLETPPPPDFDRLVRELRKKKKGGLAAAPVSTSDRRPTRGRR